MGQPGDYFRLDEKLDLHRHEMWNMLLLALDTIEQLDQNLGIKHEVVNKIEAFTEKVLEGVT